MANGNKKVGVEIVVSAVDRATSQFKEINKRLQNSPLARLNKSMKALSGASGLSDVSKSMGAFGRATNNAVGEFGNLLTRVGMLAGLGGGGLFALTKSFSNFADNIDDTSQKLGTTMGFYQRFSVVAGLAGVPQEAMNKSLDRFSKSMGEAVLTGGTLRKTFAKLGVNLQVKEMRKMENSLPAVVKKLSEIGNASVRNALGARLFGKGFGELIPMIEDFQALNTQAGGFLLTNEELERGKELDKTFNSFFTTFGMLKNIAGAALAPGFTQLLKDLQGFLVQNKEGLKQFFTAIGKELPGAFKALTQTLKVFLGIFTSVNETTGEMELRTGRLKLALAGIAAILAGPFIASLIAVATSFGGLLISVGAFALKFMAFMGPVMSFLSTLGSIIIGAILTPWGLIAMAVVGVGLLVWKYWEPISELFLSIWESMKGIGSAAASFFGFEQAQAQNAPVQTFSPSQIIQGATSTTRQEAAVNVSFDNMPRGARVQTQSSPNMDFSVDRGFAFGGY